MALVGRVKLGLLYLHETFEAVPDMKLQQEEFRTVSGEPRLTVWAWGDDFDSFETALTTDSTIAGYQRLSDLHEKRLYQLIFLKGREKKYLYPIALEQNIMAIRVIITSDGANLIPRFPSREAITAYHEACQERGISFQLQQLYREKPDDPSEQFGLTPGQREVLIRAHKRGYFNQPRNVTLEELAEGMEVSSSALGRRMRRALDTLIDQTVRSNRDGSDDES
ncbi:Bacterio-opsin activator HTH domain protein (plasmid) [Haloterrigena turkmenica DSM 5511]|uniref:Bacterio-opsin activator HTH domain protein n=1 Tax=Haloterrigena turkmenica (strain ATCC 51198 / DSM 5511 / JCM 9101 / NCIMB 13204 / VKM B-1734 / 4k) TaxID=543526 RepID=D2S2L0_HALTV|nr:helix-turn-helix domain-containing protein [Haloterrigena turkmenica]ADB63607.1 Bacterio-opsin activator HTH domain protein [Haloterrigena turkmenica DSM 5511]